MIGIIVIIIIMIFIVVHIARLVLGWVTVVRRVNYLGI